MSAVRRLCKDFSQREVTSGQAQLAFEKQKNGERDSSFPSPRSALHTYRIVSYLLASVTEVLGLMSIGN
jgi:hypothetical protein